MVEQVGGDHYKAAYQHWDWVADTELPYLEGCATKYISRWRKKGGKQDLEKAVSYLEKLREKSPKGAGWRHGQSNQRLMLFLTQNDLLATPEGQIIASVDVWFNDGDLKLIIKAIRELINESS